MRKLLCVEFQIEIPFPLKIYLTPMLQIMNAKSNASFCTLDVNIIDRNVIIGKSIDLSRGCKEILLWDPIMPLPVEDCERERENSENCK